jgi:uncharacterized protein YecT (DUF1311 family)
MARLRRVLCLSLVAFACCQTPCFAQRDGVPDNLCHGLPNVPTGICFGSEYQKANDELKALISKIQATLETNDKRRLEEAQKAWEIYRDRTCDVESRVYFGDGSGKNTEEAACLYVETRLQLKDLHAIYDWEMRPR